MNKLTSRIIELSEDAVSTAYANKTFFNDLKRVFRVAKKIENKGKEKKIGYFLKEIQKTDGSMNNKEKIIRDIYGKSQSMTVTSFIDKLLDYEVPVGKPITLKSETAYQTTQRAITDSKLNKTISASIFSGIIKDLIVKFTKKYPEFNEIFRSVFVTGGHFLNAGAFVRYTLITPDWLHFDAFQTDFFNKIQNKVDSISDPKDKSIASEFTKELKKEETEFYKTAVSYIIRSNSSAKVITASTPQIVKRVEHIRNDNKTIQLYHRLPKELGFKLVDREKLTQVFGTRPGVNFDVKKKKMDKLFGSKKSAVVFSDTVAKQVLENVFEEYLKKYSNKSDEYSKRLLDAKISNFLTAKNKSELHTFFHQNLDAILEALEKKDKNKIPGLIKEIRKTYESQKSQTSTNQIWLANRGTIFENVNN